MSAISDTPKFQKWTPVTAVLPGRMQHVITYSSSGVVAAMPAEDAAADNSVIYWMPLPTVTDAVAQELSERWFGDKQKDY